jgi:hypothetical protein
MQRDWDAELIEDRSFKIGGELFEWIYPHWEIGARLFDDNLEPAKKNGDGDASEGGFYFQADTQLAIDRIPLFLNPKNDAKARFKRLAARKEDAVPRHQFVQLYRWLVQVTGGLPTDPPSSTPSDGGAGNAGADSSDALSSTEETSPA